MSTHTHADTHIHTGQVHATSERQAGLLQTEVYLRGNMAHTHAHRQKHTPTLGHTNIRPFVGLHEAQ